MKINDAAESKSHLIEMAKITSRTHPDHQYIINKENGTENYSCTCAGYISSRKKPKMCRHLKQFLFQQGVERALTELEYRGFWHPTSEGCYENIVSRIVKVAIESGVL